MVSWHTATNRVPIGDYLRPVLELVPRDYSAVGCVGLIPNPRVYGVELLHEHGGGIASTN